MRPADPVLTELYAVRDKLAKKYDYDVHKIAMHFMATEKADKELLLKKHGVGRQKRLAIV